MLPIHTIRKVRWRLARRRTSPPPCAPSLRQWAAPSPSSGTRQRYRTRSCVAVQCRRHACRRRVPVRGGRTASLGRWTARRVPWARKLWERAAVPGRLRPLGRRRVHRGVAGRAPRQGQSDPVFSHCREEPCWWKAGREGSAPGTALVDGPPQGKQLRANLASGRPAADVAHVGDNGRGCRRTRGRLR